MKANQKEIEEKLKLAVESEHGIATVYLFGSFGTPYFNKESDVDLGILFSPGSIPDVFGKFDLQERLSGDIRLPVDVVVLNTASPIICMQVLRKGRKIIERDPRQTNAFFVRTVNFYADLKIVRRPIERSILAGGLFSIQ